MLNGHQVTHIGTYLFVHTLESSVLQTLLTWQGEAVEKASLGPCDLDYLKRSFQIEKMINY